MDGVPQFLLAVGAAYGFSAAVFPMLRLRGRGGLLASGGCGLAVMFCVLLIPAEHIGLRALAAVLCIELLFKMLDFARCQRGIESPAGFGRYLLFLIPFPPLQVSYERLGRRLPSADWSVRTLCRTVIGGGLFAAGFWFLDVAARVDALRSSFPLDHVVKFATFAVAVEALAMCIHGCERLAGFDTEPLVRDAWRSRTVGEFWWRYNTRVHDWFDRNVFRPSGGRKSVVYGVLATFFISAVLHELGFGLATSRFDGYQFAFFMLQAPAVLASRPLHRFARRNGWIGAAIAHTLTVLWLCATSMLFFHGVHRVFPFFYCSTPWLP